MRRRVPSFALFACLGLAGAVAPAAEPSAAAPLAKPGDTYLSIQVEGCANKCPSFEIYVFDSGRMTFRSNNQYTTAKGKHFKNGLPGVYNQISKYLQESGAFSAAPECTEKNTDTSVATVQAVHEGQTQKSSWSSSCAEQRAKGRGIVKVFVNQTGMWRLIKSDTRWWEKYWEDPQMTGRKDAVQ